MFASELPLSISQRVVVRSGWLLGVVTDRLQLLWSSSIFKGGILVMVQWLLLNCCTRRDEPSRASDTSPRSRSPPPRRLSFISQISEKISKNISEQSTGDRPVDRDKPDVVAYGVSHEVLATTLYRFTHCGRLPDKISGNPFMRDMATLVWLGNYTGALDLCDAGPPSKGASLRIALEYIIDALKEAQVASQAFCPQRCKQYEGVPRSPTARVLFERTTYVARDGATIGWVHARAPPCADAGDGALSEPLLMIRWGGNAELAAQVCPGSPFEDMVAEGLVRLMLVDYRGFGWSAKSPSLTNMRADAEDLFSSLPSLHAARGLAWPPEKAPIIMGRSIGAQPALHLAALHADRLSALVLDSPAICHWPVELVPVSCWDALSEALASNGVPPLRAAKRQLTHCECCRGAGPSQAQAAREASWLDPQDLVGVVALPLLILAGTADALCPRPQIDAFFNASPAQDKDMVWLKGYSHNGVCRSQVYWSSILRFLRKVQGAGQKKH